MVKATATDPRPKAFKGSKNPKSPGKKKDNRPVVYPEVKWESGRGLDALTVDKAKSLLGWEELDKDAKDYLLTDKMGHKVRCTNNQINRPLYLSNVEKLVQEILNRRWRYNGEPVIVGKYGSLLNGQHTLVALIFSEQLRVQDQDRQHHWEDLGWKLPVTIEKAVMYGVEEDDDTVNTMDTDKGRNLTDVFYRSGFFRDKVADERQRLSKCLAGAVIQLWYRTDIHAKDIWTKFKTHSEMYNYVQNHPKVLDAVTHIIMEDGTGKESVLRAYAGTHGMCAALLYLMGTAKSDPVDYKQTDPLSEKGLNFDTWDTAVEFWTLLKSGRDFKEVREELDRMSDMKDGEPVAPASERVALIVNAWRLYHKGGPKALDPDEYRLKYESDENGIQVMVGEPPVCGGIDNGGPEPKETQAKPNPTPEELESEKEKIKEENAEADRLKEEKRREQAKKLIKNRKAKKGGVAPEEEEEGIEDPEAEEEDVLESEPEVEAEGGEEEEEAPEPRRKPIKRKGPGNDPERVARKTRG